MQLYGMATSGNCWKAAQILDLTHHAYTLHETDSNAGATRTPAFLALNPAGQVPALVLDDGQVLTQSNAILLHFAEGTPWLPPPGLVRTRVHEWMFFEQYSHEPYIAVARNIRAWRRDAHLNADRLAGCDARGAQALDVMERRLAATPGWPATPRRSPTSRCSPTPTAPTRAGSTSRAGPASRPGWRAWRRCRASRRCRGRMGGVRAYPSQGPPPWRRRPRRRRAAAPGPPG